MIECLSTNVVLLCVAIMIKIDRAKLRVARKISSFHLIKIYELILYKQELPI